MASSRDAILAKYQTNPSGRVNVLMWSKGPGDVENSEQGDLDYRKGHYICIFVEVKFI